MEIKAGKEYKTRDCRKVVIYATDKGGKYPVHGAVIANDGIWYIQCWTLDGGYSLTDGDGWEIISEWTEPLDFDWDCLPKWSDRFIAMDDDGQWSCFENEPIKDEVYWDNHNGGTAAIPTSHNPKNYKGDWKESLHENPKYK